MIGQSYEAVRQGYNNLAHLLDPEHDHHSTIAVDETKLNVEETEVYVRAAIDIKTFEVSSDETSMRCPSSDKY